MYCESCDDVCCVCTVRGVMMCVVCTCRPQEIVKKLERGVIRLVEESTQAAAMGDFQTVSSSIYTCIMCVSDGVPLQLNDAFCRSLKGLPNDVFRSGGQHFPFGLALVIFPKWTYFDNYLRALITTLLRQWTRPRSPLVKRECCASNDNSLK